MYFQYSKNKYNRLSKMTVRQSRFLLLISCLSFSLTGFAQPDRWQQKVKYTMNIDMDVTTNRFTGTQKLEYTNNSPDVLTKLFYHLQWNAFQPNSSMDERSRELGKHVVNGRQDWDPRVKDRILKLTPEQIGYQKIISLKMNGIPQPFVMHETILEVQLTKPIAPRAKVLLDMVFEAQVPLQIRRSGRDNPTTNVRYTMTQWYPKLCEYDYEGWHPTPYIAREFYGVWGDFDVTIAIDKTYKLGGTGVLQNAAAIGWGYDQPGTELKPINTDKRTWHFSGSNIHDFAWAADPDYNHLVRKINGGPMIHVLYKYRENKPDNDANWTAVADAAVTVLPFIEAHFGKYPYPQYSFIQGGDGGMEYPMATMLIGSGLGTAFHEWMHSWYQMMLGTNEGLYAWMDEGFTEYASNLVEEFYRVQVTRKIQENGNNLKALRSADSLAALLPLFHRSNYDGYYALVKSGLEEPMTTHADHFNTNFAYSIASYSKGNVFLEQLGYIVGAAVRDKILLEYYNKWRFRHPNASDFIRIAETVSGLKLDWYKEYWVNGTKTINYTIDSLWEEGGVSKIRLKRTGKMPMPIDLQLRFKDGSTEMHYVPLNLMYGQKPAENPAESRTVHEPWRWTHTTYIVTFKKSLLDLKYAEIDPTRRLADVEQRDNILELKW